MRDLRSPFGGIRSPFGAAPDAYAILGYKPELVFDFDDEYYRANSAATTFSDALTHSASSNGTMVDSDGLLKWRPHNLLTYSEDVNTGWTLNSLLSTADNLLIPDTANSYHFIQQSAASSVYGFTWEFEAKPEGYDFVRLFNAIIGIGVDINLASKTFSNKNAELADPVITDGADGYVHVRCEYIGTRVNKTFALQPMPSALNTATFAGDGVSGVRVRQLSMFRSDLGGMVNNPDRGDSYVPTTSTARYLPRRGHHIWNGTSWVNEGLLHESETRTNLLHTTDALVTQSLTVTAVPHTLHFTGTGTVTLSGASTAGPLVGTGAGEQNRVSLTFTPTAASLTLTVSGTVTDAQLEVGSTPSSYIPNIAASGSATRAAETLTVPAAKLPYSATAMSIQMQGRATGDTYTTTRWYLDANNYITQEIGASDFTFEQAASGTVDAVTGGSFTSGVNTAFNIASRHGSTFINGAVDGTALTADTTPVALPDLSATDMSLGYDYMGTIQSVRMWAADITDAGLEAATV